MVGGDMHIDGAAGSLGRAEDILHCGPEDIFYLPWFVGQSQDGEYVKAVGGTRWDVHCRMLGNNLVEKISKLVEFKRINRQCNCNVRYLTGVSYAQGSYVQDKAIRKWISISNRWAVYRKRDVLHSGGWTCRQRWMLCFLVWSVVTSFRYI
jgi:hypothetical protein